MKRKLLLSAAMALTGASATARDDAVRLGVLLGLTGPVESLAQDMARSADIALDEARASGLFLGGRPLEVIRADSTCSDAGAAAAAAERLVTGDRVAAILGAACSGATTAVAQNVAIPNGVPQISPSSTSPALSALDDDGLFFRTAPSDTRQSEVLAEVVHRRGLREIAVTYTANDYGHGLADAFTQAFEALGGTVTLSASHEDGRGDYTAEVSTLAAAGGEALLVIGYIDQGGLGILRAALDLGAFDRFVLPDGMADEAVLGEFGSVLDGSFGVRPGGATEGSAAFERLAREAGMTGEGPYRAEAYDAAALLLLAMQAAGSDDRDEIAAHMLDVANAPGVEIGPGEIARGLRILAEGGEIDFEGATEAEFSEIGEAAGQFREIEIDQGAFKHVAVW